MADGIVTRLEVPITAVAEPKAAAVVVTETANGGVTVTKAEATPADTSTLILGKFKDQEALIASYKELEAKLGTPPVVTPVVTPPSADAHAQVAKAGLDIQSLTEEFTANGKISNESMAALNAAGITAEQVGQYVAGQQAIVAQIATDLQAVAGGEKQLDTLLDWAKANATKAQKEAFDTALSTGNRELIKTALSGIKSGYETATGIDPKLVVKSEGAPGNSGPQPFASTAEMTTAMKDARYKRGDRAYIASVEARVKASGNRLWGGQD